MDWVVVLFDRTWFHICPYFGVVMLKKWICLGLFLMIIEPLQGWMQWLRCLLYWTYADLHWSMGLLDIYWPLPHFTHGPLDDSQFLKIRLLLSGVLCFAWLITHSLTSWLPVRLLNDWDFPPWTNLRACQLLHNATFIEITHGVRWLQKD